MLAEKAEYFDGNFKSPSILNPFGYNRMDNLSCYEAYLDTG